MHSTENSPQVILKRYADALIAQTQVGTDKDQDEIADELIEITGQIEQHGETVARTIYELLEHYGDPVQT